VNRKSTAAFVRDASDWKWWNKATPLKLAELVQEGYKVVIFT
jgi:histidinol phosphatase-like enzyme